MSNLSTRSGNRPSRKQRESRAFQLLAVGGVASVVAVGGFLLAIVSSFGMGIPFLAAIVAVVCFYLFKRQTA